MKKKLKKDVLVQEVFALVSRKCLETNNGDISHVVISIENLALHLKEKYNITYHSEQHLYNQLKIYEKECSTVLFSKRTIDNKIYINVLNLHQFKQLIIFNKNIKVMLA